MQNGSYLDHLQTLRHKRRLENCESNTNNEQLGVNDNDIHGDDQISFNDENNIQEEERDFEKINPKRKKRFQRYLPSLLLNDEVDTITEDEIPSTINQTNLDEFQSEIKDNPYLNINNKILRKLMLKFPGQITKKIMQLFLNFLRNLGIYHDNVNYRNKVSKRRPDKLTINNSNHK